MEKTRAGIQSVQVGFARLDALARAPGPLMRRDLAAIKRVREHGLARVVTTPLTAAAQQLSAELGHRP